MSKKKSQKNIFNDEIIEDLINDPSGFILSNSADTIIKMITYAADKYYNNQSIIPDDTYDFLIDTIKDIDPDNQILKRVGFKVSEKNKIKLPYYMGSMDKIKPTDPTILNKWLKDYSGPYVYSDKLDGVSGLLVCKDGKLSLFTRGDGIEGTDITHLIKYISTIKKISIPSGIAIRGELIMTKSKFKNYEEKMANARNMVSGVVNSKTINISTVKDIDFVAYEVINPWHRSQNDQWKLISDLGLKVVNNGSVDNIDFDNLSKLLLERKNISEYEIDGIIISVNNLPPKRTSGSNPEYAFAFKDANLSASANVEVKHVEWVISKDNYIKPTLSLVPTKLTGVTISSVTAFNAKFIKDNILGPGAVIELIRSGDVIPYIQKVIKPATSGKAEMPYDIEYIWNDTGVDIIATEETSEQKIKELTFFFKKLNIKNVDESTVKKMIEVKIDTIPKIISITQDNLSKIKSFKEKMIEKIYNNISERIKNLTLLDLMIASNVFGHGMGERKLNKIMETYPDIIDLYINNSKKEITDMIIQIEGFDVKTAEYFADGLDKFIELFNTLTPDMRKQLRISILKYIDKQNQTKEQASGSKFNGKRFVFSGFRNKDWENLITSNGGSIGNSISSNTSILVTTTTDLNEGTNSKIIKAKELKIPIMTRENFEKDYII